MSGSAHEPVLLEAVLEGLKIDREGVYVDATFGRGGHAGAILERLGKTGRLIAIDRDPAAIRHAAKSLLDDSRFELIRGTCAELEKFADERGLKGKLDGLLLDLGVSSPQLDEADRGFSFLRDGPLDMRMDPDEGVTAAQWLAQVSEMELRRVLKRYGEENHAARIARSVVAARGRVPLRTTGQLAELVAAAVPSRARGQRKHPATKTFQAIRILINDELGQLEQVLDQSLRVLRTGGRLCVISFHSLEDRIVKRFMRNHSRVAEQYRGMPDVPRQFMPALKLIGKPISATGNEVAANVRARSARLRIAERAA